MKKHFLLPFILLAISLLIYFVNHYAFVYALMILLAYSITFVVLEKRENWKLGFIYISSILFACLGAEFYFSLKEDKHAFKADCSQGQYLRTDPIIGMAPDKNSKCTLTRIVNDSIVYKAVHTIDKYGRRFIPEKKFSSNESVLFFGCSFTYGDGIDDHETLPYQFQEAVDENYRIYNFAYSSYGAHQTLAILENQYEKIGTEDYNPKVAIYSAITDHIFRGAYVGIEKQGPKYRLDETGKLYNKGLFSTLTAKINRYFLKSRVLGRLYSYFDQPTQKDIDLVVNMINQSATIFKKRYHGKLYCLLWEELWADKKLYEKFLTALRAKNLTVIEVKNILPNYYQSTDDYFIYKDGHPTALANQKISEYLATFLQKKGIY